MQFLFILQGSCVSGSSAEITTTAPTRGQWGSDLSRLRHCVCQCRQRPEVTGQKGRWGPLGASVASKGAGPWGGMGGMFPIGGVEGSNGCSRPSRGPPPCSDLSSPPPSRTHPPGQLMPAPIPCASTAGELLPAAPRHGALTGWRSRAGRHSGHRGPSRRKTRPRH